MKHVIFDLGGVVFDWDPYQIIERFIAELGLGPSDGMRLAMGLMSDVFSHTDWIETDRGTLSAVDAIQRFSLRMDCPVDQMQRLWDLCSEQMQPKADTVQLIHDLAAQKIPLYVLSNMPVERYTTLRQQNDFWHLFQGIVISGEIQLIKPEVAIYRHLLAEYGLTATDCAFLDDSLKNVKAARQEGIHGIHFESAAQCRGELADWLAA